MGNGRGKLTWKDGSVYIGDFENNMRNGHGVMKYSIRGPQRSWLFYVGQFKFNIPSGNGTIYYRNENIYKGTLKFGAAVLVFQ